MIDNNNSSIFVSFMDAFMQRPLPFTLNSDKDFQNVAPLLKKFFSAPQIHENQDEASARVRRTFKNAAAAGEKFAPRRWAAHSVRL